MQTPTTKTSNPPCATARARCTDGVKTTLIETPTEIYSLVGYTHEEVLDFLRFLKKEGKL